MKMSDRFDLEQNILDCWKITDDINLLYKNVMEEELDKDKISNVLLGLQAIYSMRFEQLWSTFENLVSNKELDK
jgi:hypothetical protein